MEKKIISVLLESREDFDRILPYLESDDFSDKAQIVVAGIQKFYEIDPDAEKVDRDILLARIEREYPKYAETFTKVVEACEEGSSRNIVAEYFELKKAACGERLGSLLVSGKAGSRESMELFEQYQRLCDGHTDGFEEEFDIYVGFDESIIDAYQPENLIQIYPKTLNDSIGGGVPPGTHILIYARPECGKSMFVINMAAMFVKSGKKALYLGNEDPAKSMRFRLLNRLSGMRRHEILADYGKALGIANDYGLDSTIFVDFLDGTPAAANRLVERFEPDIVIVDQVRNLATGKKQFTKVEHLEYVTKEMRDLNKRFDTVGISVTQAGESAEQKLHLGMSDIDFSNTGMQAGCDLMLGIGVDDNYERLGRRVISVSKNKINGNHEPITVAVDPEISKVYSV